MLKCITKSLNVHAAFEYLAPIQSVHEVHNKCHKRARVARLTKFVPVATVYFGPQLLSCPRMLYLSVLLEAGLSTFSVLFQAGTTSLDILRITILIRLGMLPRQRRRSTFLFLGADFVVTGWMAFQCVVLFWIVRCRVIVRIRFL